MTNSSPKVQLDPVEILSRHRPTIDGGLDRFGFSFLRIGKFALHKTVTDPGDFVGTNRIRPHQLA